MSLWYEPLDGGAFRGWSLPGSEKHQLPTNSRSHTNNYRNTVDDVDG